MLQTKNGIRKFITAAVFAIAIFAISINFAEAALLPIECGSWYLKGSKCVLLEKCAGVNPCASVSGIPAGCPYPYYEKYRGKSGTKKYYTCSVDPVYTLKECGVVDYRLGFRGQCIVRESCNGYNMCSLFWNGYGVTCPANYLAVTIGTSQRGSGVVTCRYSPPLPLPCSNECSANGAKACSGNGFKTCGNFDADSCLEWGAVTACGAGQICFNGLCITEADPSILSGYKRYEFTFNSGNENKINFVIANNYPEKGISTFYITNLKSKAGTPYIPIASLNVDSNRDNMPDGWVRASAEQNIISVSSAGTKIITDSSTYGYQIMQGNIPVQKNTLYTIILDTLMANGGFQAGVLSGDESRWISSITDKIFFTSKEVNGSSESSDSREWRMFGRFLNHTRYNPVDAPTDLSANVNWFTTGDLIMYSSPAVADGVVYIGSYDNKLYALNASNVSKQIASFTTGDNIDSSPAVVDGVVFVGSWDKKVYALNASNINQMLGSFSTGGAISSSPAVADGIVYIGSNDNRIYALNASNISQMLGSFRVGIGSAVMASPAVANGIVYVGGYGGSNTFFALNASNISQMLGNFSSWYYIFSSPAVADGIVYFGDTSGFVYALNASDISKQIANITLGSDIYSSPAVADGVVYIAKQDHGTVFALNASNISQVIAWTTLGFGIKSSPAVANGVVYVGSAVGICALNASNINQRLSCVLGGVFDSSPAVANGVVYVGSQDRRLYSFGNLI